MRRRLLNQTEGDPASEAIADAQARAIDDVRRFGLQQPEIVSRSVRERLTNELREATETRRNGGKGTGLQGPGSGMSSRPEVLPPSPAAPRPKLKLKQLGEP